MNPDVRKLDNLLEELKYAFRARQYRKAELLASEVHVHVMTVRRTSELANEKTGMGVPA